MQLTKTQRFVDEYKKFESKIKEIENPEIKNEMKLLLKKLLEEAKKLDFSHQELSTGVKLPNDISETKNSLMQIRKSLHSKLGLN